MGCCNPLGDTSSGEPPLSKPKRTAHRGTTAFGLAYIDPAPAIDASFLENIGDPVVRVDVRLEPTLVFSAFAR